MLDGDDLGKAMAEAIQEVAKKENASPETIWKAIANEIVAHFKKNAEITVNAGILVTTSSGAGQTSSTGTGSIR